MEEKIEKTQKAKDAQAYVTELLEKNHNAALRVLYLDIALWTKKLTDILDKRPEIQIANMRRCQDEKIKSLQISDIDPPTSKRPAQTEYIVDPRLEKVIKIPTEIESILGFLQPQFFLLSRSISSLRLALQAALPGASDGAPFDTGVQEEAAGELNRMEEALGTIGGVDGIGLTVDVEKDHNDPSMLDGIGGGIGGLKYRAHRLQSVQNLAKLSTFYNPQSALMYNAESIKTENTDSTADSKANSKEKQESPYAKLRPFIPGVSFEVNTAAFEEIVRYDYRELSRIRMFLVNTRDNLIILRELLRKNNKHLLKNDEKNGHGSSMGMY